MVFLIIISHHLHVPMFFFLCNLAFIDFFYSTNSMPSILVDLLSSRRVLFTWLLSSSSCWPVSGKFRECLLMYMAYDRYNAICNPFVWIYSFVISLVLGLLQPMRVCYPNIINHVSCEVLAVIKLSCDNTEKN
ncbi:unnamed protein product [Staurois parvus]|uniref:G-protein coupled receptors family 1 profile domain-containing protein n=1 Tax=Staurois parvus TaxID=386267 RepID=A0ABN9D5I3_9NEOB|nr:unnamed protein product [Staurois parvus]